MKSKRDKNNTKNALPSDEAAQGESGGKNRSVKRKVRSSKRLFRAIDILYAWPQNRCPYINKHNVKSIECEENVVYDSALPRVCVLDIYRVPSDSVQPAVILIHGGGFSAGDKKYRRAHAIYFALNGFTVFNVNYGLSPEHRFPEPIAHIARAADFVYANAQKYGIDRDKIIIAGDSAGAYFSAMLCALKGSEALREGLGIDLECSFCGCILNCGLYDLTTINNTKIPFGIDDGIFLTFLGKTKGDASSSEQRGIYTPLEHIDGSFPPAFVIYSDNDVFCKGQGNVLCDRLDNVGVYCERYAARRSSSNHCFSLTWRGFDAVAANELMMSFAKRLVNDRIKL